MIGYGLDSPGLIPGVKGVEIFLHSLVFRLLLGSTQPPIKRGLSLGVKAANPRIAILPLPSAMAAYMWTLASTSPMGLRGL